MALADIDTIVVVMLENRAFDHMVGYLSLETTPDRLPIEGLSLDPGWLRDHANACGGTTYQTRRLPPSLQEISDPKHNHAAIDLQIHHATANGALAQMGGFVESYVTRSNHPPADPGLAMGYYDAQGVPIFDFFARNFVICDHWFAALPCGTQANRLMAMAGESQVLDNADLFLHNQYLVYDWLTDHKVSWCVYQYGAFFPFFSLMERLLPEIVTSLAFSELGGRGRFRRYRNFHREWTGSDPMPSVIFIEPEYSDGPNDAPCDDHPPTGVARGQAFLADIYGTLLANPARWARTLMIVTYDEHGGFFDHVPPLPIPATVQGQPIATTGVRVPAFLISPQVGSGVVFTGPLDHTSILQLLDDKFSPGAGYSQAVNDRQLHLNRILNALQPPAAAPRTPAIPPATLAAIRAMAASAPVAPATGASPADPANARALHQVVVQAAALHPELIAEPGFASVRNYLSQTTA